MALKVLLRSILQRAWLTLKAERGYLHFPSVPEKDRITAHVSSPPPTRDNQRPLWRVCGCWVPASA